MMRFLARRPHERDFAAFATSPPVGLFLDVGANSGMSALSFRIANRRMPILSVEANPYHERDLHLLTKVLRDFDYRIVAAGDRAGDLRLNIPLYRGVALTGYASVLDEALEQRRTDLAWWAQEYLGPGKAPEFEFSAMEVPAIPLDDLDLEPTIIKIDVEGFELNVLRGLERTIARSRPALLVETPSDVEAASAYLAPWGYRPYRFDPRARELVPLRGHSQNIFYVALDSPAAGFLAGPATRARSAT